MTKKQFRDALRTLGLTQAEFATVTGKSPRSVAGYATGEQPVPLLVERFLAVLIERRVDVRKWF